MCLPSPKCCNTRLTGAHLLGHSLQHPLQCVTVTGNHLQMDSVRTNAQLREKTTRLFKLVHAHHEISCHAQCLFCWSHMLTYFCHSTLSLKSLGANFLSKSCPFHWNCGPRGAQPSWHRADSEWSALVPTCVAVQTVSLVWACTHHHTRLSPFSNYHWCGTSGSGKSWTGVWSGLVFHMAAKEVI